MDEVNSLEGTIYKWANEYAPFEYHDDGKVYPFDLLPLTKSADNAEFICLLYNNPAKIFVEVNAFRDRIRGGKNDSTWDVCRKTFEADFRRNENAIKIYAAGGEEIAEKDYKKIFTSCFGYATVGLLSQLKNVAILKMLVIWWRGFIVSALKFVKDWTKKVNDRLFDFRLYTVPTEKRTLSLGVWTRENFLQTSAPNSDPSVTVLESICTKLEVVKATEEGEKNPSEKLQCAFKYLKEENLQGSNWITIANHPLGFYSLCIEKKDLEDIVKLQCGGAYFRAVPAYDEVVLFNSGLTATKPMKSAETESSVQISPRSFQARDKKIPPRDIMGKSANDWAKGALEWTSSPNQNDKAVVAEWLHVIAHSMAGKAADCFGNLVFGTRECNSHMLRIETAIRGLVTLKEVTDRAGCVSLACRINRSDPFSMLKSDGTYEEHTLAEDEKVKNHPLKTNTMTRRSWLAGEIHYKTKLSLKLGDKQHAMPNTIQFQPLHRLVPFRYEASLDKEVKLAFAHHLATISSKANNSPELKTHDLYTGLKSNFK